jgi:RES domain
MVFYRQATYGSPLRTEPARKPGRYHTGSEGEPTQYMCVHPLGPFAEFLRGKGFRLPEQVRHVRERTWALRLEQEGLVKVDFHNADDYGLAAKALVADDLTECQALAGELRKGGVPGIIVPSAALPGTDNVVLFGARVGSPYQLQPVGAVDVPASITAADGRPILSLLDVVCFRGDVHEALVAWQKGDRFEFREPDWTLD